MSRLHKLANMESTGRVLRNEVWPGPLHRVEGVKNKAAPLYLPTKATWNKFNKLHNELYKNVNNNASIVRRFIAKNKERIAHARTAPRNTALVTKQHANKAHRINLELRALGNKLLYGVKSLDKIKERMNALEKKRQAARARGREKGLAIKQYRSLLPPNKAAGLPEGGNEYRKIVESTYVGRSPKRHKTT